MTELQPYSLDAGVALRGISPRQGRGLARLCANTTLAIAATQAQAEVDAAKLDAIAALGTSAMHGAALLSQVEQTLAQAVPHASGRLAVIADLTALSLGDTVARSARRIGR